MFITIAKGEISTSDTNNIDSLKPKSETTFDSLVQWGIYGLKNTEGNLSDVVNNIVKNSRELEDQGQYGEAISLLKVSIDYLINNGHRELPNKQLFDLYNTLGIINMRLRDNKRASDAYSKALEIAENIQNDSCIASINNNLGEFYLNQGDLEKTKKALENALLLNKKLNRTRELRVNYTNLGVVFYQKKNYNKSEEYYKKALALIDSGDVSALAILNLNISQIYKDKGEYKVAESYLREGLELVKDKPNSIVTHKLKLVLAKCLSYQNKIDSALKYATQALELSNQMEIPGKKAETFRTLTDIYLIIGDSAKAVKYLLKYEHISDSINLTQDANALNKLLSVYEVELLKKEKLELEQANQINELTVGKQRLVIASTGFILVLLVLLLAVVIKKLRTDKIKNKLLNDQKELLLKHEKKQFEQKRQKMEQEINFKNRQLTTHTLTQVANNEFQKKISQVLNNIKKDISSKQSPNTINLINSLLSEIKRNSDNYISDEFKTYFDSVHPSFFNNLSKSNPDLTPNELRLCAFLRMGLTTKEIASLTFREVRSVESARNRLRKKLDVPQEISLQSYLSDF